MNLSKSRYCRGLQCKKMLWLEKYKPEVMNKVDNSAILEQGNMVHEVARYLFGEHINIEYTDNLGEMVKDTYRTIESYKNVIITEASFNYENNFLKSSTELKDVYINDASYQYYVLTNLGFKVTKCMIVVINSSYERNGNIELDKLFINNDITDDVIKLQDNVKNKIKEINEYMEYEEEQHEEIDEKCFKPYDCPFFEYCSRKLEHPNAFDITVTPGLTGLKFYKNGIYSFEDMLNTKISDKQRQRIEFELYDKPDYIDKDKIREFLDTLSYPLYFLDFETYQMPVPLYDRAKPYEPIPFQYSLHYIKGKNGKLEHREYLAEVGGDPRRKLAEELVKDIPIDVCTVAYNMSFEKRVIKRLATIYPDLSEHLMNIHDNIKDLEIPFSKRYYYTKAMGSSSSIKYVLPALFPNDKELDYHNLDLIHNGGEAMNSFKNMENMSKEEMEYTRERLLRYCELDTYAMVKILEKLWGVLDE